MTTTLITDYVGKGTAAARPASAPVAAGALALYYATDTGALSLWNGSAWVSTTFSLAGLSDVAESGPTSGQVLAYNGSHWANANPAGGSLGALTDVAEASPTGGQVLTFSGSAGKWLNAAVTIPPFSLASLTDVAEASPSAGQVLTYDGTAGKWVNRNVPVASVALSSLTDVQESGLTDGQVLAYSAGAGKWINSAPATGSAGSSTLAGLIDVAEASPADGQVLTYSGTAGKWANAALPGASLAGLSDVAESGPANGQVLTYSGTTGKWVNATPAGAAAAQMPLVFVLPGALPASALYNQVIAIPLTLPSGLAGSVAFWSVPPAADVVLTLSKIHGGTTSSVGTVKLPAGASSGAVLTAAAAVSFAAGDVLQLATPSPADTALQSLGLTILANGTGTGAGTGTVAGHRFWRVYVYTNAAGQYACLAEVAMAAAPGGANLIGSGNAIAGSFYDTPRRPNKAVDGDPSTYWNANQGLPDWWGYDFGAAGACTVVEVKLTARNDSTLGASQTPGEWDLQSSDDGTAWTTMHSFTSATWASGQQQTFTY